MADCEWNISRKHLHYGFSELKKNYSRIPAHLFMKIVRFWHYKPDPSKTGHSFNDIVSLLTYGIIFIFFVIGF